MDFTKLPILSDKGTDTIVYDGGDYVIKVPKNNDTEHQKSWLRNQQKAAETVDDLTKINSRFYRVPKVMEIHTDPIYVKEEKVKGVFLTPELIEKMNETDKQMVYHSIAYFLNDIHQSRSVKTQSDATEIESDGKIGLSDAIKTLEKQDIVSGKRLDKIREIQNWIKTQDGKQNTFVWSHTDLHDENMLYDPITKIIIFIDLSNAQYLSLSENFQQLYMSGYDVPKILTVYKMLSKKQKVAFSDYKKLYKLIAAIDDFREIIPLLDKKSPDYSKQKISLDNNIEKMITEYGSLQVAEKTESKIVEHKKEISINTFGFNRC
ncbi:hypothetical protein LJC18_01070 [Lachnospiraceae bacterium OttesenSCG-928-E19]|nr:hypothetical protein [Lachnospiraceae bacterium OttesenSCG-928-E19]